MVIVESIARVPVSSLGADVIDEVLKHRNWGADLAVIGLLKELATVQLYQIWIFSGQFLSLDLFFVENIPTIRCKLVRSIPAGSISGC